MGLDTLYRPKTYSEVLGQESTITILREVIKKKIGFHQSYCFSGPFGTGKTTLARIFAKALLCDSPQEGNPCEVCKSCQIMNKGLPHPDITEMDAASNSGKEDMERILEEIRHSSFTGKHKLYIVDESHSLSKMGQDLLLLPLENTLPNSEEKQLVCIFCTTEPSKMRPAILSRCAPSFSISLVSPDIIADRLEYVCQKEDIDYDRDALVLLGEIQEGHIRDCLKALDTLRTVGKITRENVLKFMHLDINEELLDILLALTSNDFDSIPNKIETLTNKVSSSFLYQKFSEYSMLAFRAKEGVSMPSFLNSSKIRKLHDKSSILLKWVKVFSSRPYNSDKYSLICDLHLCYDIAHGFDGGQIYSFVKSSDRKPKDNGNIKSEVSSMGVYVNPNSQRVSLEKKGSAPKEETLTEEDFSQGLAKALAGL